MIRDEERTRGPRRCQRMAPRALKEAERAIEHCRRHIERIRADVERRQRVGYYSGDEQNRLRMLQQVLREHEANRDRLKNEARR